MKNLIFLICTMVLFSCTQEDETLIKVKNSSQYEFTDIVVNTSGGEHNYGNLESGQESDYKAFDHAYSYAFVELKINGETFTIQPIDYVGETPLSNGKYTYELNASSSGGQYSRLSLTLNKN